MRKLIVFLQIATLIALLVLMINVNYNILSVIAFIINAVSLLLNLVCEIKYNNKR